MNSDRVLYLFKSAQHLNISFVEKKLAASIIIYYKRFVEIA